jgi:3-oxoacyl-[acyl-carrier protein] reductase
MDMKLGGKRALVTGAASGIGRATALRFAAEGVEVVALDRDRDALRALAPEGEAIHACPFDLSRTGAIPGLAERLTRRHGAFSVLVNNAAVWFSEPLVGIQDRNWEMSLRVNVTAPMALMRAVAPGMIEAGGGCIVNVASRNGFVSSVENTAYDASKAALIAMTRTVAGELARHHIRVNAVCPGVIDTPPNRELIQDRRFSRNYRRLIPMDRFGGPEEIAGVIHFLTTQDAGFITGQTIVADGGQMACQDWKRLFGMEGA